NGMAQIMQQLDLSDDQRAQVQTLWRNHIKDAIHRRADIAAMHIDLRQLLDAESVDMSRVQAALQAIAAQQVELRLAHITTLQDIQKLLTPEQQKKFRALRHTMLGPGGMMGPDPRAQ